MNEAIPLLQDFLIQSAHKFPHKIALVCGEKRLTYGEIDSLSTALATTLEKAGVQRGDRVIVFGENTPETVISFWAVLKANAIVSVVNPMTKADKFVYLLNDCRAKALLCDASLKSVYSRALENAPSVHVVISWGTSELSAAEAGSPRIHRNWEEATTAPAGTALPARKCIDIDLASIIYTSGSTGDPKGVMLTHRNMITAATSVSTYLKNTDTDIVLNVLPLAFDYGLYQMIMTFRVGARLVLEKSFAFPMKVLQKAIDEKVTGFPGVPTIFAVLAGMKGLGQLDFSNIRYVSNTAAALSPTQIEFLQQTFPDAQIYSMYGLTECKRCTWLPPEDLKRKPLSVGRAIPNTELWIVNDNNDKLGPNEVGQLVIRGATVMKGYWEKPEETAKKLRPGPIPGEQVLYTGDLCKLDEEGYLYFVGRMDDIIKTRGEKVAPKEVENIISSLPHVREVAVVGVPDTLLGQAVKAFVVPHAETSLSEKDVLAHCSKHLEAFMVPRYVEIVADLPKTMTGKIKKTDLK